MHPFIVLLANIREQFVNYFFLRFTATIKPRHKSHLIFQFTESQEMNNAVASAVLNIYVHSRKFLRASDMHLPKNLRLIDIEIAKVVKGSHKSVFKTFRNVSLPDVPGEGEFVKLNITQMVAEWFGSSDTSHGLAVKIFASKSGEPQQQSHRIVSLDAENLSTVSDWFSYFSLPICLTWRGEASCKRDTNLYSSETKPKLIRELLLQADFATFAFSSCASNERMSRELTWGAQLNTWQLARFKKISRDYQNSFASQVDQQTH